MKEVFAEGKNRKFDNSFVTDNRKARRKLRKQKEVEIGRKTHAQAVRNVNIKGVGFSRIYVNWLKMKKVIPLKQKLSLLH